MTIQFFNDAARDEFERFAAHGLTETMVNDEMRRTGGRTTQADKSLIWIAVSRNFITIPIPENDGAKRVKTTAVQVATNVVAARKALARLEHAAMDVNSGFTPTARRIEDLEAAMNDVLAAVRHLERGVTLTIIRAEDAGIVPAKGGK